MMKYKYVLNISSRRSIRKIIIIVYSLSMIGTCSRTQVINSSIRMMAYYSEK